MLHSLKHRIGRIITAAAVLVTAACGTDSPVAPQIEETDAPAVTVVPSMEGLFAKQTSGTTVKVLQWKQELKQPITKSATVGPLGGIVGLPVVGYSLIVPPLALTKATKITITAIPGKAVAFEFAPHGLKFKLPVVFMLDLFSTQHKLGSPLMGGYFTGVDQIDPKKGTANVIEQITTKLTGTLLIFPIKHFSGYLVSCA
jgi:hypothetical protein